MTKTTNLSDSEFEAEPVRCRRGTWQRRELREAFNLVADKANWKMPIDATLSLGKVDLAMTLDAIEFFAGGAAKVETAGRGPVRITHPGYYVAVGA